jgi:hypothetical protein
MRSALWLGVLILAGSAWAQDGAKGHWSGAIEVPGNTMAVEIDLDKTANGWIGTLGIPSQGSSGMPLEAIAFQNGKWSFRIKGVPGEPTFTGTIAEDGKTMAGDFTQGPGVMPFKLTKTGEPKIEVAKPSPPVAKEFVGTWEGALEVGQTLRLKLKIANGDAGATATLISLDQGGVEIPATSITQKDAKLSLTVKMVNGGYEAELNKDGTELSGTWTQNGNALPLKLKKAGGA